MESQWGPVTYAWELCFLSNCFSLVSDAWEGPGKFGGLHKPNLAYKFCFFPPRFATSIFLLFCFSSLNSSNFKLSCRLVWNIRKLQRVHFPKPQLSKSVHPQFLWMIHILEYTNQCLQMSYIWKIHALMLSGWVFELFILCLKQNFNHDSAKKSLYYVPFYPYNKIVLKNVCNKCFLKPFSEEVAFLGNLNWEQINILNSTCSQILSSNPISILFCKSLILLFINTLQCYPVYSQRLFCLLVPFCF